MSRKPNSTPYNNDRIVCRPGVHDDINQDRFSPTPVRSAGTKNPPLSPNATKSLHKEFSSEPDSGSENEDQIDTRNSMLIASKTASNEQQNSYNFQPESARHNSEQDATQNYERDYEAARKSENKFFLVILSIIAILFACVIMGCFDNSGGNINRINLTSIMEDFPEQNEITWRAIESGISEVNVFNKPSVFLVLYKETEAVTLDKFLSKISSYAGCILKENCESNDTAVVLTSEQLKDPKVIEDYGYILHKYQHELEEKNVMIVKNLDDVPGLAALAFHSLCDENNPLVEKSVFFFTIKVDEYPEKELQYVENKLRENWKDIEQDHFEPLFTRISNMIITIQPEKT